MKTNIQKRIARNGDFFHFYAFLSLCLLLSSCFTGCVGPGQRSYPSISSERIPPKTAWAYIKKEAPRYKLDPHFVYAIAWAESSLNAKASTHKARGLMQMSKIAWVTVTNESYSKAFDWKTNTTMGMRYLAHCKKLLEKEKKFNYALLAASYRYGPTAVRNSDYKIKRLPKPHNNIYKELFKGNKMPVKVPG